MLQHYTTRPQQWYNVTLKGAQSQNITLENRYRTKVSKHFPPKRKKKEEAKEEEKEEEEEEDS